MTCLSHLQAGFHLLGGGGGGGELTDYVAVRSRRGEGRLHNYNILGRGGGGGEEEGGSVWEKLSCLGGGGGEASPALSTLDETLTSCVL